MGEIVIKEEQKDFVAVTLLVFAGEFKETPSNKVRVQKRSNRRVQLTRMRVQYFQKSGQVQR